MQRIFFFFIGLIIGLILGQSESEQPAPRPAARPAPAAVPPAAKPTPPPTTADTLTDIKGIGPAFAQALHAAGITTFAQLAQLTPAEIARKLPRVTVERIEREDWIGQAKRSVTQANRKD